MPAASRREVGLKIIRGNFLFAGWWCLSLTRDDSARAKELIRDSLRSSSNRFYITIYHTRQQKVSWVVPVIKSIDTGNDRSRLIRHALGQSQLTDLILYPAFPELH